MRYKEWCEVGSKSPVLEILHSIALILALTDKYEAIATNPPYMGASSMNARLAAYVNKNYQEGKGDLFAVFMLVCLNHLSSNGKFGMINMQGWMFISSFEDLRYNLLQRYNIDSLLHLGARLFDSSMVGTIVQNVAFVIENHLPIDNGVYFRLVDGSNCQNKESLFLRSEGKYSGIKQDDFFLIPGCPLGFWISESVRDAFRNRELPSALDTRCGMSTGNNDFYVRNWFEVAFNRIGFGYSRNKAKVSGLKWFPYDDAGGFRKWYGFQNNVVNWENDGFLLQTTKDPTGKRIWAHNLNLDKIFQPHLGWSDISVISTFRYYPEGFLFSSSTNAAFVSSSLRDVVLGYANSVIVQTLKPLLNPTYHLTPGNFNNMPFSIEKTNTKAIIISEIVKACIQTAKLDWDSQEVSWDFKYNELVRFYKENHGDGVFMDANRLEDIVTLYKEYWTEQFNQLHANEEELNRQFIEIYGLQDELTPDVPLDEITILQQGEISVEAGQLVWHNDVLAKQLISYAVGCMMGRYRLDRPSLHIAYPNPSAEDIAAYDFQGEPFEIDDDGIIPLLPRDCPFDDNARNRLVKFIRQVFGESFLNENLNFLESSLGRTLEDYFVKDFWKDHKKMYSNRPIYWLFSSKKGAFQCLTYMHRMNPYTAEAVRSKYLLPYIDFLKNKIGTYMDRASSLNTAERKDLDKMQKALDECLEYEEQLHDVADRQIRFDLDDGVVVNYAKFGDVLAKIK